MLELNLGKYDGIEKNSIIYIIGVFQNQFIYALQHIHICGAKKRRQN